MFVVGELTNKDTRDHFRQTLRYVAAHQAGCCADTLRVSTSRTYDEARHGRLQHFGGRERDHFVADYVQREGAGGTHPGGKRRRCEGTGWEFRQLSVNMDISKGIAAMQGGHTYFFRKLSGKRAAKHAAGDTSADDDDA